MCVVNFNILGLQLKSTLSLTPAFVVFRSVGRGCNWIFIVFKMYFSWILFWPRAVAFFQDFHDINLNAKCSPHMMTKMRILDKLSWMTGPTVREGQVQHFQNPLCLKWFLLFDLKWYFYFVTIELKLIDFTFSWVFLICAFKNNYFFSQNLILLWQIWRRKNSFAEQTFDSSAGVK